MGDHRVHATWLRWWRRSRARRRIAHADWNRRLEALDVLAVDGTPEDLERVRPRLHDGAPQVRAAAMRCVRALAPEPNAWTGHARFATRDLDPRVRRIALELLVGRRELSSAAAILDLWNDPDTALRRAAIEATLQIPRDVLPWLEHARRATSHARSAQRCSALELLGRAGDPSDFRRILPHLADPDESLRETALAAALTLDRATTERWLQATRHHPLPIWRRLARRHLAETGALDTAITVEIWRGDDPAERRWAIECTPGARRSALRAQARRLAPAGSMPVRLAALEWLGRHGAVEDVDVLEGRFDDPSDAIRAQAMTAAHRLGRRTSRDALVARALDDPSPVVRQVACRILQEDGRDVAAHLRERLAAERDAAVVLPAFHARLACAPDLEARRAIAIEVLDAELDRSPEHVRAALLELRLSGQREDHVRVAAFLVSPEEAVRNAAIQVLPSCGAARDTWERTVREAAADGRWEVRRASAELLRTHGLARDLPLVRQLLADEDPDVRAAALEAGVVLAGGQRAWREIVSAGLRDEHWNVRRLAVVQLGRGGLAQDVETILPLWFDEDREVAEAAITASITLGPNRHRLLRHARQGLEHEVAAVRERALQFLAIHGDESDLTLAHARLASAEGEERAEALSLLVELAPVTSTWRGEVTLRVLDDAHWKVRARAAEVLGSLGEPEDVRLLVRAAWDDDEDVRAAALRAIDRYFPRLPDDADSIDDLATLARLREEGLRGRGLWILAWFSHRRALAEVVSALGDVDPQVADLARGLLEGRAGNLPLTCDRDPNTLAHEVRSRLRDVLLWIEEAAKTIGIPTVRAVPGTARPPLPGSRGKPLDIGVEDTILALDEERGPAILRACGLEALVAAQCRAAGLATPDSPKEQVLRILLANKAERALVRRGAAFQFAYRSLRRFVEQDPGRFLTREERQRFLHEEDGQAPARRILGLRELLDLPGLLGPIAAFGLCLRFELIPGDARPTIARALASLPPNMTRLGTERLAELAEDLARQLGSEQRPALPATFPQRRLLARCALTGLLPGIVLDSARGTRRPPTADEFAAGRTSHDRYTRAVQHAAAHLRAAWIQRASCRDREGSLENESLDLELLVEVGCEDLRSTPWLMLFQLACRAIPGVRVTLADDTGHLAPLGHGRLVRRGIAATHGPELRVVRERFAAATARQRWHVTMEPMGESEDELGITLTARGFVGTTAVDRRRPLESRPRAELFRDAARTLASWTTERH